MITINLLPKERRKANTGMLVRAATVAVAVVLIGAAAGATAFVSVISLKQKMELKGLEDQLADLEEARLEYVELEAKQKVLNEKKSVIKELVDGRIEWSRKLSDLAAIVPERVWLEELELRRIERKVTPPARRDPKTGETRRSKPITVIDEYVDIVAATGDINEAPMHTSRLMTAIFHSGFYEGFEDLRHVRSALEPWKQKGAAARRDDYNPNIWRFELQMKRKKNDPQSAPDDTAPGARRDEIARADAR